MTNHIRCTRTKIDKETNNIITKAKKMVDAGTNFKEVMQFIDENVLDSIQNNKAVKSVIGYEGRKYNNW